MLFKITHQEEIIYLNNFLIAAQFCFSLNFNILKNILLGFHEAKTIK